MAQIDIKEAYLRFYGGTLGTVTVDCTNADSDLTFTAKSKHIGSDKISVTYTDPGSASAALAVAVTDREIVVTLATDATSGITTTAAQLKTAIEADSDANALVTVTFAETSGTGIVNAETKVTLDGQEVITVKLGEGNCTFTEHKNRVFTKDRGSLDTVKNDDDEPLDLSFDSTWEWIKADTGGTATLKDVLEQRGEASAWVSTADDDCQPYCIDVELWNAPGCGSADDEILMFEEFYYENIDHDLRDGTLSLSGRCNRTVAVPRRVPAASIDATN
jgi:hypothetical protein